MKKILFSFLLFFCLVTSAFAKVNINTADANELEGLPGIGPAKAEAIIKYRKEHGAFKSVDDLVNVKGIGDKIMEKVKGSVEIDAQPVKKSTKQPAKK